jgi:alkylhydroperoxidase family enzyme
LLAHPQHHHSPFPYFVVEPAFTVEQCAMLETLFVNEGEWQLRDGAFYRCALREVTAEISAEFLSDVTNRMREITGLPLVERILVTAQIMTPGQAIGIHSDRPLLGYESVRLVVQLNPNWQAEDGGVLQLFASDDSEGEVLAEVNPIFNAAFGFVLNEHSYHAVTRVSRPRHSLVFNFWHAANTPELTEHVQALFAGLHFSELPAALNSVITAAEAGLPEETTLLAGTAAIALRRWGYDDATVMAGYQYSAGLPTQATKGSETWAAIRLADWVARLHRESFDLARWETLRSELAGARVFTRLTPTWRLCLP